ncbi:MAG: formate dehydrogenase accessory sulfurtransferase FdhD [Cyclobacteriaceae bacterium]|nr:formate dehydrogenase accessory sulfurtransferase FdhD [Cyclobacteriaceae bacterium]
MATRDYQGAKFNENHIDKIVDSLTVEEALQININDAPFTLTMRTPGDDKALIRGLLHSEDVLLNATFSPDIILNSENKDGIVTKVDLKIPNAELGPGYSNSRSLLSVSSCGICGRTEIGDLSFMGRTIDSEQQIPIETISRTLEKMNAQQFSFKKTGGTHAAAAFSLSGELLCSMEDIGRHNAVDKVIGCLIFDNNLDEAFIMTVSGRVSYEIVTKCFKAGIPVLVAVSAPSSLAVDYSKELGITLFGFCREGRATCYSYPQRISKKSILKNKKAS